MRTVRCFTAAMLLAATGAAAGETPAPGQAHAQHRHQSEGHGADGHRQALACQRDFEQVVADGRGFGMAFPADRNGYPGPMHALDLADHLGLTAEQRAALARLVAAMFAESRPRSARLLEAEARLQRLFEDGTADEASVRAAAEAVERARTGVRVVHLLTHLRTRDLLTPEQRRLYHAARWPR